LNTNRKSQKIYKVSLPDCNHRLRNITDIVSTVLQAFGSSVLLENKQKTHGTRCFVIRLANVNRLSKLFHRVVTEETYLT